MKKRLLMLVLSAAIGLGLPVAAQHPEESNIVAYIANHVWPITGLPRSYYCDAAYWDQAYTHDSLGYPGALDDPGRIQERFITQYGLNLYDGACYQLAMCLGGGHARIGLANYHARRLLTNRTLQWNTSRAYTKIDSGRTVHLYGDNRTAFWGPENANTAYFFRVISELYSEKDPLLAQTNHLGTNAPTVVWQDWKPVTGENAWCAYIGPLQTAWFNFSGRVPVTDPGVELAFRMLPAVAAMQNRIGAVYHVPSGVTGKGPDEISNENNFSLYAGLVMFRQVLQAIQAAGENLIRNPGFEDEGQWGANDALFWEWEDPDYHAGHWGNVGRENWEAHGGAWLGAIRGTWAGVDYGGYWQEAPTRPGLTNSVAGWFKRDNDWYAAQQEWKIEYYNGDYYFIGAVTGALSGVTNTWGRQTLTGVSPAGAVWARVVIAASGVGPAGALQFDDLAHTVAPQGVDVAGAIQRLGALTTNQESYFRNYLYNAADGVFHTGGTYSTNGAGVFTPYVFSGYWIGGPYRGSNAFAGVTALGIGYAGTNLYSGYDSVKVTVVTTNDPGQVNIRIPAAGPDEFIMTKVTNNLFTYTIPNRAPGMTNSFRLNIIGHDYGPEHAWVVQVNDAPRPYTSLTTNLFAMDCQTWGMAVLGARRVDEWLGAGKAWEIWQNAKRYGGYFEPAQPGVIRGVGFSDINNTNHDILTAEWTFGAILMCRTLARDYWEMGRGDLAADLSRDAELMRIGIEALKTNVAGITTVTTSTNSGSRFTFDEGWAAWGSPPHTNISKGVAYLYANRRYEIPFGWWANPLPSMASTAWAIMTDHDFNPFILGGGETNRPGRMTPWLDIRAGVGESVTLESRNTLVGRRYQLQQRADLAAGGWATNATAATIMAGITPYVWSNLPAAGIQRRFYRLVDE